jgi:hypothetical protein
VIEKTLAIFVLLMMTIVPLHCSFASDKERCSGGGMKEFRLGELKLCINDESEDGNYLLRFSVDKEVIFTGECAFKTQEPKIVQNAPLPNCSSLLAYCFSGGAHCCTTLFIATECGHKISLDAADLAHSDGRVNFIEADGAPRKVLRIFDWQFAYYAPEDSQIQLSFASSPAMARLLVFDDGHWRPDKIGEFSRFYSHLSRQAMHEAGAGDSRKEPESAASVAIKAAYYSIMSGEPSERTTEVLNQLLPMQWRPESPKVVGDIRRAASEFNPVEKIR